ncbi:MAG: hypothetical protein DYG92_03130 [Leptolyngbya sp. PLA1]|nr:hypothetical protein [Leptolyngbya sp. PLA1]
MSRGNTGPSKSGGLGGAGKGAGLGGAAKSVGAKLGAGKPAPKPAFTPGKLPSTSKALKPGAPVAGAQRMAQPSKAAAQVNKDRMNKTLGKLGF